MDLDRWRRLRSLSEACAELPEHERQAWLQQQEADPELRQSVLDLLAQNATDGAGSSLGLDHLHLGGGGRPGDQIGSWRLLGKIGEGGMGEVFRAERADGEFQQHAAIKLLRPGLGSREFVTRFRGERQILAQLDHPGIARLLDGGSHTDGRPWLALEFVEGRDLLAYCNDARLNLRQRLLLFCEICEVVSYSHRRLVVHRDIKPSNVMVSESGAVKLLDFGVAKLLIDDDAAFQTGTGTAPMTPAYAAPEQLRGESVQTATDIHALGLLLFELLAGVLPQAARRDSPAAAAAAILTTDPSPASVAFAQQGGDDSNRSRIASQRACSQSSLRKQLRGDLDAILMKALRPRPEERYPSADAFADDVRRHLTHQAVQARRGSRRYRLARFASRNALSVALAAIALLGLLVGLGAALWQAGQARVQRDLATVEARKATESLDFMREIFAQANPSRNQGRELTARQILQIGEARLQRNTTLSPAVRAPLLRSLAQVQWALGLREEPARHFHDALDLYRQMPNPAGITQLELDLLSVSLSVDKPADTAIAAEALIQRLGPDADPGQLAIAEHVLGIAYGNQERLDQAMPHLLRAQSLRERAGTDVNSGGGAKTAVLSYYLDAAGEPERAERILRGALARMDALEIGQTEDRAELADVLAGRLLAKGELTEAEHYYLVALAIVERDLGPDHPETLLGHSNYASLLTEQGRYPEALAKVDALLTWRRSHLGENSKYTEMSWSKRGSILIRAGQPTEAIDAFTRALAIAESAVGARSKPALNELLSLAEANLAATELHTALSLADRALALQAELGGDALATTRAQLVRAQALRESNDKQHCAAADAAQRAIAAAERDNPLPAALVRLNLLNCQRQGNAAASVKPNPSDIALVHRKMGRNPSILRLLAALDVPIPAVSESVAQPSAH